MCKSNLKRGSYVYLKKIGHRGKLSLKLTTWVRNGFWPFKTQKNARKLLEEAKFKSYYLFQARGIHFELENMEFLHGQWVSLKFLVNFKLMMLIFELSFSFPLMSSKLISNTPKFWTQPLVIKFEP